MTQGRHLGIRVDNDLHYKLTYIAKYEGRSVNKQVIHLIYRCIRQFEQEHGSIDLPPQEPTPQP